MSMATVANNDTLVLGYHAFANASRLSHVNIKRSQSGKDRASPVKLTRTLSSPANETFVQQRDRLARAVLKSAAPSSTRLSQCSPTLRHHRTSDGQRTDSPSGPKNSDKGYNRSNMNRVKKGSTKSLKGNEKTSKAVQQESESQNENTHVKSEASMRACLSQAARQMKTYLTKKKEADDNMRRYGVNNSVPVDKRSRDNTNIKDIKKFGYLKGKPISESACDHRGKQTGNPPLPSVESNSSPTQRFVNNNPYNKAPRLPPYSVYYKGRSKFEKMIDNSNARHDDESGKSTSECQNKRLSHDVRALTARYSFIDSLSRIGKQMSPVNGMPHDEQANMALRSDTRRSEISRLLELNKDEFDELTRQYEAEVLDFNRYLHHPSHLKEDNMDINNKSRRPKTNSSANNTHSVDEQAHLRYSHERHKSAISRPNKIEASLTPVSTRGNQTETLYTTATIKIVPGDSIIDSHNQPRSAILRQYGVGLQNVESSHVRHSGHNEHDSNNQAVQKHKEGIKRAASALRKHSVSSTFNLEIAYDLKPDTTKCQSEKGDDAWSIQAEDDSDASSAFFSSYAESFISNEGDEYQQNRENEEDANDWPVNRDMKTKEYKRNNLLKCNKNKANKHHNPRDGPLKKLCISNSSDTLVTGKTFIKGRSDRSSSSTKSYRDQNMISVNYLNTYTPSLKDDPSCDSQKSSESRRSSIDSEDLTSIGPKEEVSTAETNSEISSVKSPTLKPVIIRPDSGCCVAPLACGSSSFISINNKYDTKPDVPTPNILRRALSMFEPGDYVAFQHDKFSKALDMENHRPLKYYGEREKTKFLKVRMSNDKSEFKKKGVQFTDL